MVAGKNGQRVMGRKYKHLYNEICSFDNIWLAARNSRKGKRNKSAVIDFEYNLEKNLFEIQESLLAENYNFGEYKNFTIHIPKKREISSAPYKDRVVHHALCNVIEPILDRAMIFDSYACRKNKGTHKALDKAHNFLKQYKYTLKFDIKKYFFTIDHEILLYKISKKITDKRVLNIIKSILSTYSSDSAYYLNFDKDDLFDSVRPRGLPIGNLTSQLFANFYLDGLDRFIKENLKIKGYVRYMDDGVIFSNSKAELHNIRNQIVNYTDSLRLKIHDDKTQIAPVKNGIRFLGFHLYSTHRRILRENLKRFKKKFSQRCKLYSNNEIEFDNLLMSLNAWLGYVGKNRHIGLIDDVLSSVKFNHPNRKEIYTFCNSQ